MPGARPSRPLSARGKQSACHSHRPGYTSPRGDLSGARHRWHGDGACAEGGAPAPVRLVPPARAQKPQATAVLVEQRRTHTPACSSSSHSERGQGSPVSVRDIPLLPPTCGSAPPRGYTVPTAVPWGEPGGYGLGASLRTCTSPTVVDSKLVCSPELHDRRQVYSRRPLRT